MSKFGPKYDSDIPEGHRSQEARDPFRDDTLLRKAGFRIEHRPKGREAVWSRWGVKYGKSEALLLALEGEGGK